MPMTPDPSWSWATDFRSFTLFHLVVVLVCGTLMVGSVVLGRRWRGTPREKVLRYTWVWATIGWQAFATVWWLLPANFDPLKSLPIHLCDIAAWVAPLALLTQDKRLRALLYFWGIGLSTQAFFTPVLRAGYDTYEFWLFWMGHTQIVGSAVYDCAVLGYRPTFAHWWRVVLFNIALVAVVMVINEVAVPAIFGGPGSNYWYVGRTLPEAKTLLNELGPWPMRAVWLALLGIVAMWVAWVPWGVAGWIARRRAPEPADR